MVLVNDNIGIMNGFVYKFRETINFSSFGSFTGKFKLNTISIIIVNVIHKSIVPKPTHNSVLFLVFIIFFIGYLLIGLH